jgi:ectoine hydroxylase-related dioxygenase (phytanoyl-CoA dioxygenase family)
LGPVEVAHIGDAIVHHVKTVHGSTGNTSASRVRRALALRYLGDDIRYLKREGAPPDSHKSETLRDGDPIASPDFPQIWTKATGYQQL